MKEFTEDGHEIEADGFYTFPRDLTPRPKEVPSGDPDPG